MTSKLEKELLDCVNTPTSKIDSGSLRFEYFRPDQYHAETEGPILHIKKPVILDLDNVKVCLKKRGFKAVQTEDEWHIFKPRS